MTETGVQVFRLKLLVLLEKTEGKTLPCAYHLDLQGFIPGRDESRTDAFFDPRLLLLGTDYYGDVAHHA